jgi:ATP-dependent Clp protease ATP-binding subunit ClpC
MSQTPEDIAERAAEILKRIEDAESEEQYRNLRDQLYGLGEDVAPILRRELDSWHFRRRMAAATNLGRLGDRTAVTRLVDCLSDPQAGVREMALFSLGILGDSSVVDAVRKCLDDYDSDVRYRALIALDDLGYPGLESILIDRLREDDAYGVREQALTLLAEEGTPHAVPAILESLLESERQMQRTAEEALDSLVPRMGSEDYKRVTDEMTKRERRLVLNYFQNRNLQEVYPKLAEALNLDDVEASADERGLDKYGRILSDDVEQPLLERAWGRDETVDLLMDHCTDPDARRSLLLVGEAGVGKTAIIHEFARRAAEADEPLEVLETNTSELISGTRYLGDWESKLKEMTEAIIEHGRVILYLTNPNDLLGAGAHSKSDENFADFFKPYLHRGELTIVAESTEEELKQGLSSDPGFLRLFRKITLQPMNHEETLEVMRRRVEARTVRGDRDVVADEACLETIWDFAKSFYTRSAAPGRACDLQDALIDYTVRHTSDEVDPVRLDSDQVPACLAEETGLSLDLLDDNVALDLEDTQEWFTDRLVDQPQAVERIVDRMAMIKSGLVDPRSPLGVYFLVGPTGVGKTYLAQLVAERIFGDQDRLMRFDLSEYQGRYAVEKLIGSPHDRDREGLLTEQVSNQPFSVLLFDEFEKADPEIYHLFLQILDEGRLTDARGRTTDFRQTLIFLTSNLGASSQSIAPVGFDKSDRDSKAAKMRDALEDYFAPEFLNRLDDTLVFTPLSESAMAELVDIELEKILKRRGIARRSLEIDVRPEARLYLQKKGFSERFGARELHRTIEQEVLTPLSRLLVSTHDTRQGSRLVVRRDDDGLDVAFAGTPPRQESPGPAPPEAESPPTDPGDDTLSR